MNIQQYIENPQLINNLSQEQKISLFTQLNQYQQKLQQDKIKYETELQIKQKEQQGLFQDLQRLTNKQTIPEIQEYISTLDNQLSTQLQDVLTQYQKVSNEL